MVYSQKTPFIGVLINSFLLLSHLVSGQSDSLVLYDELKFDTDFESEYYSKLFVADVNAFEVLMAVNQQASGAEIMKEKQLLRDEIDKLKALPKPKNKKNKYMRNIYNSVHSRFLKKYELKNYFNEVFSRGAYNCVSACALYSMVFDELNINYVIKETPSHVYLVVEPEEEQFLIETTDPNGGFNNFSQNFKATFVNTLAQSKLISQSEVATRDVNSLFSTYYFTNVNLTLKELVALQYSNDAVFKMEKDEFLEAVHSFRKSYMLYPNDKTKEMYLMALSTLISTQKYSDMSDVKLYGSLTQFDNKFIKDEELYNEFLRITQQILVDNGNSALYDSTYNYLSKRVSREVLLNDIKYAYFYERGRILYNRGSYRQSLSFLEQAYIARPLNVDVETLFLSCLGHVIEKENDHNKRIEQLEQLVNTHNNLLGNNIFGGAYLNTYLIAMANAFNDKKVTIGKEYQSKFEEVYQSNPDFVVEEDLIGRAYSKLAVYYFRLGQYTNARKTINKGLQYVPNNPELITRKRMINY